MTPNLRMLRKPQVLERLGSSHSSLYLNITRGLITRPVQLGPNTVGWPAFEVDMLLAARMAGKTDVEIRALVDRLHAQRETIFADLAGAA
jgi:prophage regulatory protein